MPSAASRALAASAEYLPSIWKAGISAMALRSWSSLTR